MPIRKIYDDVRGYVEIVLSDFIKLLFTFAILKAILLISDFLFTEKLKILEYVEIASHIGILMIFIIDIILNVYVHTLNRIEKIKKGGEAN